MRASLAVVASAVWEPPASASAAELYTALHRSTPMLFRGLYDLPSEPGWLSAHGDVRVETDVDTADGVFNHVAEDGSLHFPATVEMSVAELLASFPTRDGLRYATQQLEVSMAPMLGMEIPPFLMFAEPTSDDHFCWVSGHGKQSRMHYDLDDGFLVQIHGSKRIWILPPGQLAAARPVIAPTACAELFICPGGGDQS